MREVLHQSCRVHLCPENGKDGDQEFSPGITIFPTAPIFRDQGCFLLLCFPSVGTILWNLGVKYYILPIPFNKLEKCPIFQICIL